jgi:hypothetical protein
MPLKNWIGESNTACRVIREGWIGLRDVFAGPADPGARPADRITTLRQLLRTMSPEKMAKNIGLLVSFIGADGTRRGACPFGVLCGDVIGERLGLQKSLRAQLTLEREDILVGLDVIEHRVLLLLCGSTGRAYEQTGLVLLILNTHTAVGGPDPGGQVSIFPSPCTVTRVPPSAVVLLLESGFGATTKRVVIVLGCGEPLAGGGVVIG